MPKNVCKALYVIFVTLYLITSFCAFAQEANEKPQGVPYTMHDIHAFWDAHLNHVIMEQLVVGKYPLPEIQKYYLETDREINRMYGQPITINPSWLYNEHSHDVLAGGSEVARKPTIVIFVPAIMDKYTEYPSTEKGRRMFDVLVVTTFTHESEHLLKKLPSVLLQTREWLVTAETDTWAKTCENVLAVFVKYGYPLDFSGQSYWNDWNACGKQNNACWKQHIRQSYSDVLDRRFKK